MSRQKLLYNENELKNAPAVLVAPQGMSQRSKPLTVLDSSVPYGYCHCGCGELAPIAEKAYIAKGLKKGDPFRYIYGHNARKTHLYYIEEDRGYFTPCWIWQRYIMDNGYGVARHPVTRASMLAHRCYFECRYGEIAPTLTIDHLCRNRACVNPEHLEAVPFTINVRRGAAAKLTLERAQEIRRLRSEQNLTYVQLAALFGVGRSTVGDVICNKRWVK